MFTYRRLADFELLGNIQSHHNNTNTENNNNNNMSIRNQASASE